MTELHFMSQIKRLADTYGAKTYGTERSGILWQEVKDFSDEWMTKAVDRFIGSRREPPLLPEFAEAASRERERVNDTQKRQHSRSSEDFWKGLSFPPEELGVICDTIRRRLQKNISDEDYARFQKSLREASKYTQQDRTPHNAAPVKKPSWKAEKED